MNITRTIAVTATAFWVAAGTANAQTTTTETQTSNDGTTSTTTIEQAPSTEGTSTDTTTVDPVVVPVQVIPGDVSTPPPVVNNTVIIPPDEAPMSSAPQEYLPASRLGIGLMAGGGVQDFVGDNISDMTGTAGFWDVRAIFGTRSVVGLEAAYVGSAQSIDALGLDTDATLVSNGLEADIRIHAPLAYQGTLMQPYAFGGVGWQRYDVMNTAVTTASLNDNDDVVTLPVGAGFAAGYQGFLADVRFTYRWVEEENLLEPSGGGSLTNWNLGAHLGYEF